MTFSIDNPRGVATTPPPLGKYVWEKPSEEQGLMVRWVDMLFRFLELYWFQKGAISGVAVLGLGRFSFLMVRWVDMLFWLLELNWFQKGAIEVDYGLVCIL